MEKLINVIKNAIPLSPEAEAYLISIGSEIRTPKGSILIRQGQRVDKVYFVSSGCLRSYFTDIHGKEHTLHFAAENNWISDYIAFHGDEAATLTIECLQDSDVVEFNATKIFDMLSLFPELEPVQRANLVQLSVRLEKRILNQLRLSAAERYDVFLQEYPSIEQHARNYHIASYLGITQQSLSRIRAERALS